MGFQEDKADIRDIKRADISKTQFPSVRSVIRCPLVTQNQYYTKRWHKTNQRNHGKIPGPLSFGPARETYGICKHNKSPPVFH